MTIEQHTTDIEFFEADFIIDESGVIDMVSNWLVEDGIEVKRDTLLRLSEVLVGWLATGFAGLELTTDTVAAALRENGMAHATPTFVLDVTRLLLDLMDYSPLPQSQEPLTRAAYEGVLRAREEDAERLARKRERHTAFANALLRSQLDTSGCLEGGLSIALGHVSRTAGVDGVRSAQASEVVSAEPDAGFTLIDHDTQTYEYGWEYEVATLVSSDPLRAESVPNIVIGIAGHKPHQHGLASGELIDELLSSGRTIERVSGGLSYFPTLAPDLVQTPLREHGAELVMEYTHHHEGRVLAAADDAILVEGRWYRSDLPQQLLTANKDFHEAQQRNRKADGRCVLDPFVESALEKRRDALLAARRRFEAPRPNVPVHKFEQTYAYGTSEWQMAYTDSVNKESSFRFSFRDAENALAAQNTELAGQAAHGFITTLIVAAMNAGRIAQWDLYHSLDKGNGVLVDEWSAMLHLILPRLAAAMTEWSIEMQPDAVNADPAGGQWNLWHDEDTYDWVPDGAASIVEMNRATPGAADRMVEMLASSLREQATLLLLSGGHERDLSQNSSIALRLKFIDAEPYAGDEDDVWEPVPADGVLIAAEATIRPRWDWHHA